MLSKIVAKLKSELNAAISVVRFGDARPKAPYVVVKPESSEIANATNFRIIAHMMPGQQSFLEDLVRGDIPTALRGYETEGRKGNLNKLYALSSPRDIITGNDDGTISMERVYYMPGIL